MLASPDHRQDALHAALTSVARAIADSLDVKQVWSRVGDACRTVVAFDGMGVARLAPDGQVHLLLSMGTLEAPDLREVSFPRAEFSEALWPHADHDFVLIADARRELDASFAVDRYALTAGLQSMLRLPLGRGDASLGSLVLTSLQPSLLLSKRPVARPHIEPGLAVGGSTQPKLAV